MRNRTQYNLITKRSLACGQYFKKLRELAGLSQGQVARLIGYSEAQYISNFERGVKYCPKHKLKELAAIYKVEENQLAIAICTAKQLELEDYYEISKD